MSLFGEPCRDGSYVDRVIYTTALNVEVAVQLALMGVGRPKVFAASCLGSWEGDTGGTHAWQ